MPVPAWIDPRLVWIPKGGYCVYRWGGWRVHVISFALGAKGNVSLGSWLQFLLSYCKALHLSMDPRSFLSWDRCGFSILSQKILASFLQQGEFWINLLVLMYWCLACSSRSFTEWGCFWPSQRFFWLSLVCLGEQRSWRPWQIPSCASCSIWRQRCVHQSGFSFLLFNFHGALFPKCWYSKSLLRSVVF